MNWASVMLPFSGSVDDTTIKQLVMMWERYLYKLNVFVSEEANCSELHCLSLSI